MSARKQHRWRCLRLADDLPVFMRERADDRLLYAPGYVARVHRDAWQAVVAWMNDAASGEAAPPACGNLISHARRALRQWETLATAAYTPVCLTLHPTLRCNLHCQYCFSDPVHHAGSMLTTGQVRPAAELVAGNCAQKKMPMTLVIHGGGEPTLAGRRLMDILDVVESEARDHGVALSRYIATNGTLPPDKAADLLERFDWIGLSCDGPPHIHDRQRPMVSGRGSSDSVERTADMVRASGRRLSVRATITRESAPHQAEIAEYLCARLRPSEIHVEPVYHSGRALDAATMDARDFVSGFIAARAVAKNHGVAWRTSGARPHEIHGPYCHVFRDVLQLGPDGRASVCFKPPASDAEENPAAISASNAPSGAPLRRRLLAEPEKCAECFNRHHCVRGCPESCPLDEAPTVSDFRCQVHQQLAGLTIEHRADQLGPPPPGGVLGAAIDHHD